ncbi:MAG: hypothetical protein ABF497_05365 [Sporolactobacillus sp.]
MRKWLYPSLGIAVIILSISGFAIYHHHQIEVAIYNKNMKFDYKLARFLSSSDNYVIATQKIADKYDSIISDNPDDDDYTLMALSKEYNRLDSNGTIDKLQSLKKKVDHAYGEFNIMSDKQINGGKKELLYAKKLDADIATIDEYISDPDNDVMTFHNDYQSALKKYWKDSSRAPKHAPNN